MAHKKAGGSSRNGRDSNSQRLGLKIFGGEQVLAGNIIARQRGTKRHPRRNAGSAKDRSPSAPVPGRRPHPYSVEDAETFIAQASRDDGEIHFFITLPDDRIIGACGIGTPDRKGPELGYWLGVRYWGKGYATEAARALIDHAFTEL